MKLSITERIFNNKTDAVAYWERRQWNFLGIKTRFLGMKQFTAAVAYWERRQWNFLGIKTRFLGMKQFTAVNYSDCGESKTMKIENKNK